MKIIREIAKIIGFIPLGLILSGILQWAEIQDLVDVSE